LLSNVASVIGSFGLFYSFFFMKANELYNVILSVWLLGVWIGATKAAVETYSALCINKKL
jgi:hypothetical protein